MKTLYAQLQEFAVQIGFTQTSDALVQDYFKSLTPLADLTECEIMKVVGNDYQIAPERMRIHAHPRPISEPRMVSMFLIYKGIDYSLQKTGAIFTKSHATVIHACHTVVNMYETNAVFRYRFTRIILELGITLEMLAPTEKKPIGITSLRP